MLFTTSVLFAVAIALAAFATLSMLFAEERRVARRLKGLSEYEVEQASLIEPLLKPFMERVIQPALSGFAKLAGVASPLDYRRRIARRLVSAGAPDGMGPTRFLAAKSLAALGTLLLVAFAGFVSPISLGSALFLGLLLSAVAFYLPDLWLRSTIVQRRLEIRRSLPDMLDMLTISVESGLGFDAAVAKLVASMQGPLAEEMSHMLQEVQAGMSRRDALKNLADRVDVMEMSSFVMSIVQAEVFGISTTRVLRTQSAEMRVKRRQMAEEIAQKAPVKIVFPLVACILPATLIVLAGPAIVAIGQAFGMLGN